MATLDNGSVTVEFFPEWDYQQPRQKVQASSRATSGALYQYKFSDYRTFKMNITHLADADRITINQWWRENIELNFVDPNGTSHDVVIVNKKEPFAKNIAPYDDLWEGILELSEYDAT